MSENFRGFFLTHTVELCVCITTILQMQDIREITGYLLIVSVNADIIPLTSLVTIRGRTLFQHGERRYSVLISHNYRTGSELTVGLRELQLSSLHGQSLWLIDTKVDDLG